MDSGGGSSPLGLVLAITFAIYCFIVADDRRMRRPWLWGIFGFVLNILAASTLHGNCWLKEGESRHGGRGWDSCRWFIILSAIVVPLHALISAASTEAPAAVALLAALIICLVLWIPVIILGLVLKKDVTEDGPTGPFRPSSMLLNASRPRRASPRKGHLPPPPPPPPR